MEEIRKYDISDDTFKMFNKDTYRHWTEEHLDRAFKMIELKDKDAYFAKEGIKEYIKDLRTFLS